MNVTSHSPHWLLYCLGQEDVIGAVHEPPGLRIPCCVFSLTDAGVVEVHP